MWDVSTEPFMVSKIVVGKKTRMFTLSILIDAETKNYIYIYRDGCFLTLFVRYRLMGCVVIGSSISRAR